MKFAKSALPALLLLALAGIVIPSSAQAQVDRWGFCNPDLLRRFESVIWGTQPSAPGTGEVVVVQHVLSSGQTFPLPTYPSDGATAQEDELFWTTSIESIDGFFQGCELPIENLFVTFAGRRMNSTGLAGTFLTFRVTVVAVRKVPPPTSTKSTTFGEVKGIFR